MKRVLDVGNCGADQAAIRELIESNFAAQVDRADQAADALRSLESAKYALVLVNRRLDCDDSDGMEVIRQIKCRPDFAGVPVMMITNFPEHQEAAQAAGAVEGFGKRSLDTEETLQRLRAYLA